ncbi:hypothetical protein X740_27365 [Mesorhizobium sp. LNHC221B00]|nr:hypothetical protein X740_27365 [Mesorhizobium sp. LNHC221B00]
MRIFRLITASRTRRSAALGRLAADDKFYVKDSQRALDRKLFSHE